MQLSSEHAAHLFVIAAWLETNGMTVFAQQCEKSALALEQTARIEVRASEYNALGKAYIRLRALIPHAFETPHAPTQQQIWEHTENCLRRVLH